MTRSRQQLLHIANEARDAVRFYNHHSHRHFTAWQQVPFVSYNAYVRTPILRRVTSYDAICISRTYLDGCTMAHGVKVLDRNDLAAEYSLLDRLLKMCRLKTLKNVLVVSDADQAYAASEFVRMMCFVAENVTALCAPDSKNGQSAQPSDVAFMFGSWTNNHAWLNRCRGRIGFVDVHNARQLSATYQILTHPIIGWLGIKPPNANYWRYPVDCYHFERVAGRLVVTAFINRAQPIVRLTTDVAVNAVNGRTGRVSV